MPIPHDYETHQAGLDAMAHTARQPAGSVVAERLDGLAYCIVHFRLVDGLRQFGAPGNVDHACVFEDRLDHVLTNQGRAVALQRGVYLADCNGEADAQTLWNLVAFTGITEQGPVAVPHRLNSWLRGDAVYVHFPADRGIGVKAAVVHANGAQLPPWP